MLLLYWLLFFLVGSTLFVMTAFVWYESAKHDYGEPANVLCPETMEMVEVLLDTDYAARTRLASHERLRIAACTRWPENRECDQACAPQVPLVADGHARTQIAAFGTNPEWLRDHPLRMTPGLYQRMQKYARLHHQPR